MYTYKYPHPSVTTDCVVFGFDGRNLNLLLIKRGGEPFKDRWALPGGFLNIDETAEHGALRELQEETGVQDIYIRQFHTFTKVDRDPRERVLTVAHLAFVRQDDYTVISGDDAAEARWFAVSELPPLAFDHAEVIGMALENLRNIVRYEPLVFRLLNETFTLLQLQMIYEAVFGRALDSCDFQKKILSAGFVVPVDNHGSESGCTGVLCRFDEEKYSQYLENRNIF